MAFTPRASIKTTALAPAALATTLAAAPALAGIEAFTDRLEFTDGVSMTLGQNLDGLDPHEVEIEDASHLWIAEFTMEPGTVLPWHTHPALAVIGVTEGEFVFVLGEDCVRRDYSAGKAVVDTGDRIHSGYNPSEQEETVVVTAYFGAPADGELSIPIDADEAAAHDERCELETPHPDAS